jgi:cysteine desulfurase
MTEDELSIGSRRERLLALLRARIPDLVVNGHPTDRLAGNLHISVPDAPNSAVVARLRDAVALSTGAACSSGIEAPSHVLGAIGLPANLMEGALRIGVGKFTSDEEVLAAAEAICQAVEEVRAAVNS